MKKIKKGISTFELTKKRMEITKTENGITIINDSYNASYDSMKLAIQHLSNINAKRKIAVLGDMFELGEFAEELHKKVGEEVAKNKIDKLFVIGDESKNILSQAIKNGLDEKNTYYAKTKEDLILKIKNTMQENDAFLFKASNGMKLFEVVNKILEMK